MDRRFLTTLALALVGFQSPALLAQSHLLPPRIAQRAAGLSNRSGNSQIGNFAFMANAGSRVGAMVRLPATETSPRHLPANGSRASRICRLPAKGLSPDLHALSSAAIAESVDRTRPATRRRYPSTERISAAPPQPIVPRQSPTYRWDPRDESLVGVANRANQRIEAGFKLANKGAMYGARAEFRKALMTVSEALDAQHGVTSHSQAVQEALQAMKEAANFSAEHAGSHGRIEQIVATHQTPILKHAQVDGMPALIAMQRYYAFAQERLVAATGGAPVASDALYAMGKLYMALADTESKDEHDAAKAMTFLQAAMMVDASNFAAANELGVMLARFGHLREAREVLRHSASVQPMPETWKNLEVVHSRLGEGQLAERARWEWQRQVPPTPPVAASQAGAVQWVAPAAFAGHPLGVPQQPTVPPMTAEQSTGFSLWPWR